MEQFTYYLQEYWQWVMIILGLFILLGAILGWEWLCKPPMTEQKGFLRSLMFWFGDSGYRFGMGIIGFCFAAAGTLFLILI